MQALYQLSYNPEGWRKYRIDIYPCQGKKKIFFKKIIPIRKKDIMA